MSVLTRFPDGFHSSLSKITRLMDAGDRVQREAVDLISIDPCCRHPPPPLLEEDSKAPKGFSKSTARFVHSQEVSPLYHKLLQEQRYDWEYDLSICAPCHFPTVSASCQVGHWTSSSSTKQREKAGLSSSCTAFRRNERKQSPQISITTIDFQSLQVREK